MGKSNFPLPAPGLCCFDAACYVGICPRGMHSMRADGTGPHYFRIGDEVRYWPADLDCFLQALPKYAALASVFRTLGIIVFDPRLDLVPREEAVLTTLQAARSLGVCVRTMSYWRSAGEGPHFTNVKGRVLYHGRDMRAYIQFERQVKGET